jgi:hypothetical protein
MWNGSRTIDQTIDGGNIHVHLQNWGDGTGRLAQCVHQSRVPCLRRGLRTQTMRRSLSLVATLAAMALSGCLCSDETVVKRPAPDGRHVAILLRRGCGATTSDATEIVIRGRWSLRSHTAVVMDEPARIELEWRSSSELLVKHTPSRVYRDESVVDGVHIHRVVQP